MVHPRSLSINAPHPHATTWTCTKHGDLLVGEVTCGICARCEHSWRVEGDDNYESFYDQCEDCGLIRRDFEVPA